MGSPSEATNLHPSGRAMTELEAAAEAWGIGESFAGDAFSDDGNSLSPSDGPCPTEVGRTTATCPVAWEARERALKHAIATILPAAPRRRRRTRTRGGRRRGSRKPSRPGRTPRTAGMPSPWRR